MAEAVDITNKTLADFGVEDIEVITVAKVGTKVFAQGGLNNKEFYHSTVVLHNFLKNRKNTIIISGMRNPLDRNISYMFESYYKPVGDVVFRDGTRVIDTFICNLGELVPIDTYKLIEIYKNKTYHDGFNRWFYELFEITGVNKVPFNKELGVQLYKMPENNNYILFYVHFFA